MLKNLKFLFMPHYWFMNYPYSEIVDRIVNCAFEKNEIQYKDGGHYIKLGNLQLWAANIPYACFDINGYRPSRQTIFSCVKKLDLKKLKLMRKEMEKRLYEFDKRELMKLKKNICG